MKFRDVEISAASLTESRIHKKNLYFINSVKSYCWREGHSTSAFYSVQFFIGYSCLDFYGQKEFVNFWYNIEFRSSLFECYDFFKAIYRTKSYKETK